MTNSSHLNIFTALEDMKTIRKYSLHTPEEEKILDGVYELAVKHAETLDSFNRFLKEYLRLTDNQIDRLVDINITSKVNQIFESPEFKLIAMGLGDDQYKILVNQVVSEVLNKWLIHLEYPEERIKDLCHVYEDFLSGMLKIIAETFEEKMNNNDF
jgi:uncharacterized radical SAM superfamily Fe-S cluster-containing enzyme